MPQLVPVLIGGGKISEQHLAALRSIPGLQVAGVCDLSPALARFMASRFGVANWYTDYRTMLQESGATVAHVLTPPATHQAIVRDCLEHGCHVIVEKPVALSNAAFHELWELAATRGLHLIENHNYRFNGPTQQVLRAIHAGRVGTVEEVEVRMGLGIRAGGRYADMNLPHPSHGLPAGIIHEFITHLAYLLLELMPKESTDGAPLVRAAWRNHGGGELFKYDDLDALIFRGAAHGRIRFSCRQFPDCLSLHVRGSKGVATAELFHPMVHVSTRRAAGQHLTPVINALAEARDRAVSGVGDLWGKIRNRTAYEGLTRFLSLTYAAMRSGDEPPVTFADMDRTTRLIDALLAPENRV